MWRVSERSLGSNISAGGFGVFVLICIYSQWMHMCFITVAAATDVCVCVCVTAVKDGGK